MGFQQGLSGLNIASKNLDVIGNNVANSSTVGFKSGQAQFADVFAASLSGAGTSPVGLGAKVAAVTQQFTQGNITTTNNPLDIAINGGGFFRLSNAGTITYSRNGQFQLDKDGFIVNSSGLRLTGYPANAAGQINTGDRADLRIDTTDIAPQATGASTTGIAGVAAQLNLDSRATTPTTTPFSYTNAGTYNNSTALTVYDSLGTPVTYSTYFVKSAANSWDVHTAVTNAAGVTTVLDTAIPSAAQTITGGTYSGAIAAGANPGITITGATGGTAGGVSATGTTTTISGGIISGPVGTTYTITGADVSIVGANGGTQSYSGVTITLDNTTGSTTFTAGGTAPAGTLNFDSTGALTAFSPFTQTITAAQLGSGAADLSFPVDFTGTTQYGGAFGVNTLSQDGFALGKLAGFNAGQDGIIVGRYTNGQSKNLGQIVLASFRNPQGLQPLGDNQWSSTSSSGPELLGVPSSSGAYGPLQSAAVEDSNVDLTAELVNMITAQRVYQANAQTIRTQDQILQTLVNLR